MIQVLDNIDEIRQRSSKFSILYEEILADKFYIFVIVYKENILIYTDKRSEIDFVE